MRDYLLGAGHEVSIVTPNGVCISDNPEQLVQLEPGGFGRAARQAWSLWDALSKDSRSFAFWLAGQFAALHRRKPIDLVEMEESFGWCGAVAKTGLPVVTRLHGPYFLSQRFNRGDPRDAWSRRRERREAEALAVAAAITAPSRTTMDAVCARYGCSHSLRQVISNPVPLGPPGTAWTLEGAEAATLLWVGKFDVPKGADLMLAGFARAVERRPELRLDMVGPDPGILSPEGELLNFELYCSRFVPSRARERIRFHGLLSPATIGELRRKAALTIVTSRSENFPYAVAEAMAVASPVLAVRWPGVEELVTDGETGWIVDHESPEALAAGIEQALLDGAGRERIGRRAWSYCKARLSQDVVGERSVSFYADVIARSRA